jgi:hypothetical protein
MTLESVDSHKCSGWSCPDVGLQHRRFKSPTYKQWGDYPCWQHCWDHRFPRSEGFLSFLCSGMRELNHFATHIIIVPFTGWTRTGPDKVSSVTLMFRVFVIYLMTPYALTPDVMNQYTSQGKVLQCCVICWSYVLVKIYALFCHFMTLYTIERLWINGTFKAQFYDLYRRFTTTYQRRDYALIHNGKQHLVGHSVLVRNCTQYWGRLVSVVVNDGMGEGCERKWSWHIPTTIKN